MTNTDISILQPVTEAAKQLAEKLGISLSELYTTALTTYVITHQHSETTTLLDALYASESSSIEPSLVKLQLASINDEPTPVSLRTS